MGECARLERRPLPRDLSKLRILLVHEWIYTWAGAERVLAELVELLPHAHLLAGIVTPDMRREHEIAARARETWVGALPGAHRGHRWFLPLHAAAFAGCDARDYDLIVSVSHAFGKLVRARTDATHVCYCLTPPRYLWDLQPTYDEMGTVTQRLALKTSAPILRAIDRYGAQNVSSFISISRYVADRVRRAYSRESTVVYPPVRSGSTSPQNGHRNGTFLLSLGRLVPYKRVDLAVRAAEELQVKLVVAGDGPERERLERMAGRHTEFVGQVSEQEASRLMSQASAFVFCAEEDFGIAPLEANSHGTPVVAYRRGAACETLREGETAVFFDTQSVTSVASAIGRCLGSSWDPDAMRHNASRFAPGRFREQMLESLGQAVAR